MEDGKTAVVGSGEQKELQEILNEVRGEAEKRRKENAKLKEENESYKKLAAEVEEIKKDREEKAKKLKEIEDADLAKKQEFKTLAEKYQSELEAERKKALELETKFNEANSFKEDFLKRQKENREKILAEIKEISEKKNDASIYEIAEVISDNEKLEKYKAQIGIKKDSTNYTPPPKVGSGTETPLSVVELTKLKNSNPAEYQKQLEIYQRSFKKS